MPSFTEGFFSVPVAVSHCTSGWLKQNLVWSVCVVSTSSLKYLPMMADDLLKLTSKDESWRERHYSVMGTSYTPHHRWCWRTVQGTSGALSLWRKQNCNDISLRHNRPPALRANGTTDLHHCELRIKEISRCCKLATQHKSCVKSLRLRNSLL